MSVTGRNRPSVENIEGITRMLEYVEQELGRYHPQAADLVKASREAVLAEQEEYLMSLFNLALPS